MHARQSPDTTALRERIYGIWHSFTWKQYFERVQDACLGLLSLGLGDDETVAIIGDNRPEWVISELAAQAAGAKSVGIYQDAAAEEVFHIIEHARVSFIVVEDQEQVDKILELRDRYGDRLDRVRKVIYFDPKGLRSYELDYLISFTDLEAEGRRYKRDHPELFDQRVAAGKGEDIAILSTTSGTTGTPKLAMLSHSNLLTMGRNLMEVDPLQAGDEFVSFLPLAWIGEQMVTMACNLQIGFVVNFPEEPETVQNDIREIAPRVMFSPPRIWENMVSQIQVKIADSTFAKRMIYRWAMNVGHRVAETRAGARAVPLAAGDPVHRGLPIGLRWRRALADWLVFRPIRHHLGMSRLARAYTGGAALGPDVFQFFHVLGVNLKQIYGQTECSGIAVAHRDNDVRFQTVGTPIPQTELRIADDGEVLLRSPAIMRGYYHNSEATESVLTDDGWLRTGDAGYLDDNGHLVVIDRVSDVMILGDGTTFSPQFIENKLKFSVYIKEAVVFGGDQPFVTSMINIDFDNVGKWAENQKLAYTTYTDLAQKPEVYALVCQQVERANRDLPEAARIRRFLLLHKELDADDAELTRTRKVRRKLVAERYADIVAGLYGIDDHLDVETSITYQDGRTAELKTRLKIETMAVVDNT
ncbi:MAG: AMP-binding protein [Proteobacteria bacterium]|nr:AMP-binding protein [Pseudomonadota bacterium]